MLTFTISEKAVVARINRRLRRDGQMLRKTRGELARRDLGDYWVHELSRNLALETRVDPEEMARELGVLDKYEEVEEA